jgi:hypothetical protein
MTWFSGRMVSVLDSSRVEHNRARASPWKRRPSGLPLPLGGEGSGEGAPFVRGKGERDVQIYQYRPSVHGKAGCGADFVLCSCVDGIASHPLLATLSHQAKSSLIKVDQAESRLLVCSLELDLEHMIFLPCS